MKKSDQVNEILTLDLTSQEADLVWSKVKESGFEPNLDGLKSFLLLACGLGEKGENSYQGVKFSNESVKATMDFLQNNPEVLTGAKDMLLKGLKGKIFGKK